VEAIAVCCCAGYQRVASCCHQQAPPNCWSVLFCVYGLCLGVQLVTLFNVHSCQQRTLCVNSLLKDFLLPCGNARTFRKAVSSAATAPTLVTTPGVRPYRTGRSSLLRACRCLMSDSHASRTAATDTMAVCQHLPWKSSCITKEVCEQQQKVYEECCKVCCCENEACKSGHVYARI